MSLFVSIECYIFIQITKQLKTEMLLGDQGQMEIKKIRFSVNVADNQELEDVNDKSMDMTQDEIRRTYWLAKSQMEEEQESIAYDQKG